MSVNDLFERRNDFYLSPAQTVRGGIGVGILIGVVALVAACFMAEPARIWSALLLNTFFFFSIALGGAAFSAMQEVVGAVWGRPIKRIHESFASFLPVGGALLIFILLCISFNVLHARELYLWMVKPEIVAEMFGKNVWLQPQFFVIRNIAAILIICLLAAWQLGQGVRRDFAAVSGDRTRAAELGQAAKVRLRHWCAPILIAYAICYTLLGFDLIMSLAPLWFSTLFGGWLFAIAMQTLMATLLIFLFVLKPSPIGEVYKRQQFHDVGKLMHGFTIFFAYLTYAHVLTYWYGNMPEETEYFIERIHGPWLWIVLIAPIFCFVIPLYSLIFKAAKWTAPVTITLAIMILLAQWFVYVLVVTPATAGHHWTAAWVDFGLLAAMVSLFLMSVLAFGKRIPMVGLADPLLLEALSGDHH